MHNKRHSLLDLFAPIKPSTDLSFLEGYKYKYYDCEGKFKGTNDEVIGWNARRPGWLGFITKSGSRWYVPREDLTPESLALALKVIEEKEKEKAERSRICKEREQKKLKERAEAKRMRVESSLLDGREEEILQLKGELGSINKVAMKLGIARATLVRKLQMMGEEQ